VTGETSRKTMNRFQQQQPIFKGSNL